MLVVPMSFEDRAHGVIVVSADGRDRFGPDDEATLTIFAGYAAQAIVNFEHLDQLNRQQAELEHQLASQRRLLEVNERLLSTLDPKGVLEMIADSLKTIVPYDALTIYRCDFEAGRPAGRRRPRPVRRGDPRIRGPDRASASPAGSSSTARRRSPTTPTSTRARPDPGHAVRARVDDRRAGPGRRAR